VLQDAPATGDFVAAMDGVKKGEKVVTNPSSLTVDGAQVE
jgi:hypothetical protein